MASVTASARDSRPSLRSLIRPATSLKPKRRTTGARRPRVSAILSNPSARPERRRSRRARNWKSSGAICASDSYADFGELVADRGAVERLEQISLGARRHGAGDLVRIAFSGAEQDHRPATALLAAHALDEIQPLHAGQIPVQKNQVRHLLAAGAQARHAVLGLIHRVAQAFEDAERARADHAAVVNHQAMLHERQVHGPSPQNGGGFGGKARGTG